MAALLVTGSAEIWMSRPWPGSPARARASSIPPRPGLLPDVVPADGLQPANALRSTAASVSEILGPVAAGAHRRGRRRRLGDRRGRRHVRDQRRVPGRASPDSVRERERASFLSDLRDGWIAVRSRRWLWTCIVYAAVANVMWGAWTALGPVVADRELGGAGPWGTVIGATGVGALIGSVLATRVRPGRPLVFVALMEGLFALPLAFLAAGASVPVLALGAALSGAGLMLGMSVWETTLQRGVPQESLSRVSSYDWFGSYAFYPLGLAAWGAIAGAIGVQTALWLAFGLFAAAVAALSGSARRASLSARVAEARVT